jgi:hypothetical protein
MMNKGTMTALQDSAVYEAVEHALANFLGTDDLDEAMVELVAFRIDNFVKKSAKDLTLCARFDDMLAGTSTYVQTDLDELAMNDYIGELVEQLENYDVI